MKDFEPLLPLTLIKHRHAIVRQNLVMDPGGSLLDVGGTSYKRDADGKLTPNYDTPRLIGINLTGDKLHRRQKYFSVNIANDYNQSRCPDVIYDGSSLPFGSNSVTAITAIDVLEHVPREHTKNLISEICRVAANQALLVFPFDSINNVAFESQLSKLLEKHHIPRRASLDEHRKMGLVKIPEIEHILKSLDYYYEISYHSPLEILIPYHNKQVALLAAYEQQSTDKITTQDLLLKLQKETEDALTHHSNQPHPHTAYRVLFNVDTRDSI